jgi:trk system potassium uptake protein TrkH
VQSGFNVVSIMTTTGYGLADTDAWPMLTKAWLFLLMFIGGCGGSTGGGIKVVRYIILLKYAYAQMIGSYAPQRKHVVRLSGKPVTQSVIDRTLSFFFLYLIVYAIGVLVMACYGYDWAVTLSSVAACLNNIGPGFSLVGATGNYAFMEPFAKVFLSVYMVAGRLELFAIIIYFAPDFWKR